MSTEPKLLYHGSLFQQTELMPGYKRTGKITSWDKTESNQFLYATSVKDTAIELGFASAIEKMFDVEHFRCHGGEIHITTDKPVGLADLCNVTVYLYTIRNLDKDSWLKNDNQHNGLTTEYKTDRTIMAIDSCVEVDIAQWIKSYKVFVRKTNQSKEVALEAHSESRYSW